MAGHYHYGSNASPFENHGRKRGETKVNRQVADLKNPYTKEPYKEPFLDDDMQVFRGVNTIAIFNDVMSQIVDEMDKKKISYIAVENGEFKKARKLIYGWLNQNNMNYLKSKIKIVEEVTI